MSLPPPPTRSARPTLVFIVLLIFAAEAALVIAEPNTKQHDCVPLHHFLRDQYHTHFMFSRRGVSTKIVKVFYCSMAQHVRDIVLNRYPHARRMKDVWICPADIAALNQEYDMNALSVYIQLSLKVEPQLFYLPPSEYPDHTVLPFNLVQRRLIRRVWQNTMKAIKAPPSDISVKEMCQLPPATRLFYDPFETVVRNQFTRLIADTRDVIQASHLLYDVLAIVVRLELLHVDQQWSMPLLRHCVAHIFNGIRSTRLQRDELFVFNGFLPAYHGAYLTLTRNIDDTGVPSISRDIIRKNLGDEVDLLLNFNGWGRLTYLRRNRDGIVTRGWISSRIFGRNKLNKILREAKKAAKKEANQVQLTQHNQAAVYNDTSAESLLHTSRDSSVACSHHVGYWHFPAVGSTLDEQCCGGMCETLMTISVPSSVSVEACCTECNAANSCANLETESVKFALKFQVLPYGTSPAWEVSL